MDSSMVETRRYKNIKINEDFVKEVLLSAESNSLLDISGADLSGDEVYYLCDTILGYRLFAYQSVNISYTNIALGFDTLVNTISECKGLHTLRATNNELSHDNGASIARLLSTTGSLKKLDLSVNNLSDKGIAAIFGCYSKDFTTDIALSTNLSLFSLTELNLVNNDIHDMGVLALCKGLRQFIRHNKAIDRTVALNKIYLNGNHIGDKGAFSLAQLLRLQSPDECGGVFRLTELGLSDNDIGPAGLNELLNECMIDTTVSVREKYNNKKCKCTLQKLYIGNNKPDLSVLETLSGLALSLSSQLIKPSYYAQALELIDLQFTETACKALLQEASSYLYSEKRVIAEKGGILTSIFKQLSLVLPDITAPLTIDFGLLPKVLTLQCLICYDNDDFKQFYDISGALCAIGDPVVAGYFVVDSEIYDWINSSLRTMNTNQINDNSILPLIQELNDSKVDATPAQAPINDAVVTNGGNEEPIQKDVGTTPSTATTAPVVITYSDKDVTKMNYSENISVTSNDASKRKYIAPKSDLERSQTEFARLRSEHQQAFNVLASEIKKLLLAENTLSITHGSTNEYNISDMLKTIINAPGQRTPENNNTPVYMGLDENTNESPFSISEMMSPPPIITPAASGNDNCVTEEDKPVDGSPIMYSNSPVASRASIDTYGSNESKFSLQDLVKDAVLSALQSSKVIEPNINNVVAIAEPSAPVNPTGLEEKFNQMIMRMDVMQERVVSLEAELITKNNQSKTDHETILLLATRLQQLEKSTTDQVTRLQERITELEKAITEEHESSLLLLSKLVVMQ